MTKLRRWKPALNAFAITFTGGDNRKTLNLKGDETISVSGLAGGLKPQATVPCTIRYADGTERTIDLKCRIDTAVEVEYVENGGVLQYVLRKQMTNQSLRERFGLSEGSSNTVSQIITATMEQGLVKNDPNAPESRRYARYIPIWA